MTRPAPEETRPSAAADELRDLQQQVATLQEGLETNRVIGAAVGLLMAESRLNRHDAFEMLRQMSQDTNTKLALIAARLVEEAEDRATYST